MISIEGRVGRRIAASRREAGLTQEQLADRIGVTFETVSRIERGLVSPSLARIVGFATVIGIEVQDLFVGLPSQKRNQEALESLMSVMRGRKPSEIDLVRRLAIELFRGRTKNKRSNSRP